jgi:hypothetical protein
LTLSKEVKVEMDEKNTDLAQVPVYTEVTVVLSADNKSVEIIKVSLTQPMTGVVKAIDADKRTVTLLLNRGERERDMVERTFPVGKEARIVVGRQAMALGDVKVNDRLQVRLTPDRKTIQSVLVVRGDGDRPAERPVEPRRPEAGNVIKAIDPTKGTITFTVKRDRETSDVTLKLKEGVKIYIGEKEGKQADLQVGQSATYKLADDKETIVEIRLAPKRDEPRREGDR